MGIDDGVSGGEYIESRKGLTRLIETCQERGVSKILCEDVSRFSRDMMVQESGYKSLMERGIQIVPVKTPDLFDQTEDPSRTLIRQVLGAFVQFEKSSLVNKLKVARDRIRGDQGKCEGRRSMAEKWGPELIKRAKTLRKRGLSFRGISKQLFKEGYDTEYGNPLQAIQCKRLTEAKWQRKHSSQT